MSLFAKDFNKQQLSLRLEIVKFLSNEGLRPKIDKDGDVTFTKGENTFYLIISDRWNDPYLVTFYVEYVYEDEIFTKSNLESCISSVAQYNVVKLYCMDTSYSYRSDIFCENADVIKSSFYSIISHIEKAEENVAIMLSAGLGGIDMINNKVAVFDKALEYYKNNDYNMSFYLFKYLADIGYEKAYGFLGLAYNYGEGVSKNDELMIRNYEKALESGYYWCAYCLGEYYYNINQYKEAIKYFMKCGANDNPFQSDALYSVGKMHEYGEGTEESITQAIIFYKKSVLYATKLDCDARLALMRLGEKVERKKDFVKATKTMLMGLSVKDMFEKGEEYEYGLNGRYVSLTKAYAFYKAAADKDYTKAEYKMGEIYISKYYPFQDKLKSVQYYQKAFRKYKKVYKTDGYACYKLGYMYQNGCGMEKNSGKAKFYYKSGALLGDENAAWSIGLMYKEDMEYTEAYKFLLRAAEKGHGMAMYELAKLYEGGLGVSYSKDKAIEWYVKCVESSCLVRDDAEAALKRLGVNEDKR